MTFFLNIVSIVVKAFNPRIWEAEAGISLSSRSAWSIEVPNSQGCYTDKPCLEKNRNQPNKKLVSID